MLLEARLVCQYNTLSSVIPRSPRGGERWPWDESALMIQYPAHTEVSATRRGLAWAAARRRAV